MTRRLLSLSLFVLAVGCGSQSSSPKGECTGDTAQELKVCAKGATLQGVDVSYYQGNVDWTKVKTSGRTFAFARVSDGLNYPDTKFAANWPAMKAAGVVRGTYQFFRPAQDPAAQAKLLVDKIKAAGGLVPGDLPPVLDIESADGQTAAVVQAKAKTWLTAVKTALGVEPIVYTAAFMSPTIGTSLAPYKLWVANYTTTCPTMPDGWTFWSFWQNSDKGSVSGISGNVDTNFFNGTLPELQALTLKDATPPAGSSSGGPGFEDPPELPEIDDVPPTPGSQGATIGSGDKQDPPETQSAPITPCP